MSDSKHCKFCNQGYFDCGGPYYFGQDVECVNGVLIDIDEAHEGWQPDVCYPLAPCHPNYETQEPNDSDERLAAWASLGEIDAWLKAIDIAAGALATLPTVSVTDGMVERAVSAFINIEPNGGSDDDICNQAMRAALESALGATVSDGWEDIATAPRDGTLFLAICPTGAGHPHYMHPCVMRHEGKLYSTFQYNNGAKWVDWPTPDPTHWKPLGPLPAPPTIE